MTLLAAIIFAVSLNAQEFGLGKFGIKAGVGITNIAVQDETNVGARLGYYAGITYEYKITDLISFVPEIVYSLQGARTPETLIYDSYGYEADYMLNLSYLNIPLIARINVYDKIYVDFGPQLGFLVGAQYKLTCNGETEKASFRDRCNNFDFAVAAGVAYGLTDNLYVNARCNIGVVKLFNYDGERYINRAFYLGLGYKF